MITAPFADADLRPALRARLLLDHACEPDTIVLDELGLCRGEVRVDMAVVNGLLHGYEIKSDRDSLRRLGGQSAIYNRVLDRVTLVVGERHLHEALGIVPAWWGILRIDASGHEPGFRPLRRGRKNPTLDPRALVELLWLEDAMALLEHHRIARGMRGKPRRVLWDRLCDHLHADAIAAAVRAGLRARVARPDHRSPR